MIVDAPFLLLVAALLIVFVPQTVR